MKLFYRELGAGRPIVIAHGLYGSSDNWLSIAKLLAEKYKVILVDLRNHGQSPHSPSHSYSDLADDLFELFNKLKLSNASLMGHSMGGKAAMQFAINHPDKLRSLVIVDISPRSYTDANGYAPQAKEHFSILTALRELPLSELRSRGEAEEILSSKIPSLQIRQFLLKNLDRDENNKFVWKLNLNALWKKLPSLMGGIKTEDYIPAQNFPVLFIKGEQSPYIDVIEDKPIIKELFPSAEIISIPGADHWVHAEQQKLFFEVIEKFLAI